MSPKTYKGIENGFYNDDENFDDDNVSAPPQGGGSQITVANHVSRPIAPLHSSSPSPISPPLGSSALVTAPFLQGLYFHDAL